MKVAHYNHNKNGFTLIEILVVIAIIGILASITFGVTSRITISAKNTHAKQTAKQVEAAITGYFTEYRRMPNPGTGTATEGSVDFATDKDFMDILLAIDTEKNRRKIRYYSGNPAKKTANGYIKGLGGDGGLWDAFGNKFGVRMDVEHSGRVQNPWLTEPSSGEPEWGSSSKNTSNQPEFLELPVVIWSSGKETDRADDNVLSWE